MCYNYTGSKFRLSMPYLSVGIIPSKHSIAHPLQGLGDFQGRVIIVLSMHTPSGDPRISAMGVLTRAKRAI